MTKQLNPGYSVQLLPREHLILAGLAQGKSNKQIARACGVVPSRVANQIMLLKKMYGAETTVQLVALAVALGDVRPARTHEPRPRAAPPLTRS